MSPDRLPCKSKAERRRCQRGIDEVFGGMACKSAGFDGPERSGAEHFHGPQGMRWCLSGRR